MKDLRKIAIFTVPVAILIALVLFIAGCSNPDDQGSFGFNIYSNSNIKAAFCDPVFRQVGFETNDPFSEYLTEGVGLKYYDQQYLIDLINPATSSIDIASPMISNLMTAELLTGLVGSGVKVRIVTEKSNFDILNPGIPAQARQIQQMIIDAGVQVRTDLDDANRLMQERYMIIDNTYLLVGSADFMSKSFSESINNVMVIESLPTITNPTTASAADVHTVMDAFIFDFEQMFNRGKFGPFKEMMYKNSFEDTGTKIEVYFGPNNNILEQIVDELNNADNVLYYAIQQFTDGTMLNNMAIMYANIPVMGVVDSITNIPADTLAQLGAISYDGEGYNSLNHKFIAIDFPLDTFDYEYPSPSNSSDPVVITGSANWNEANFTRNDENLVIVHDLATAYMYGLVEFQSNVMGANKQGMIYGECRSAVNNVPLECTIEIRVEATGFLPGLPDEEEEGETTDSDPETGFYSLMVPGGLTDVTVTEVPGSFQIPNYIAGNELLFPGGSQRIFWYMPVLSSGSGSGGGGGGGGPP